MPEVKKRRKIDQNGIECQDDQRSFEAFQPGWQSPFFETSGLKSLGVLTPPIRTFLPVPGSIFYRNINHFIRNTE
jgi:hypothetical protein